MSIKAVWVSKMRVAMYTSVSHPQRRIQYDTLIA